MVFLLGLLLLAAFPRCAGADLGGFTIASFHTDLTVRPDAELLVEEHIDVDFSEPRHGIYRLIPIRYTDRLGTQFSVGFRLLGVDDGAGHPYAVKTMGQGRNINLRIGSASTRVTGRKTYVIRYLVRDGLGRFPDHDEIYWNATGNEWGVSMARATAFLHLPPGTPPDSVEAVGYAGPFGSRAIPVQVSRPEPGTLQFEVASPLAPMEGLTIDAIWPLGHVVHPGRTTLLARFAADNLPILFPFVAFLGMVLLYRRTGRDPSGPGATVVRYEPPPGIGPSELGTLMDEKVDLRDITATIVDLAIKGYLVIEIVQHDVLLGLAHRPETRFTRTQQPAKDLAPHEQLVLQGLFEKGDSVFASDLREEFYRYLPKIQDALYDGLTRRGFFAAKPSSVRRRTVALGVLIGGLAAFLGFAWTSARGYTGTPALPIASGILTFLVMVGFSWAMPRRTREGVKARSWGLGFQEFVDRVEGKQLDTADPRSTFETMLPYAMALGIAAKLARRFEGIYAQGGPIWYSGYPVGRGFSTPVLEQSLTSSMASTSRALTASPRSSGSGGGGFSGGGGGGGGGGSW